MSNTKGSSDSEDFNKFFKDKLEHWEEEPPMGGWKSIENVLDKKQANLTKWYAAAAVLLLLLPTVFFILTTRETSSFQETTTSEGSTETAAMHYQLEAASAGCIEESSPECNPHLSDAEQIISTGKPQPGIHDQITTENSIVPGNAKMATNKPGNELLTQSRKITKSKLSSRVGRKNTFKTDPELRKSPASISDNPVQKGQLESTNLADTFQQNGQNNEIDNNTSGEMNKVVDPEGSSILHSGDNAVAGTDSDKKQAIDNREHPQKMYQPDNANEDSLNITGLSQSVTGLAQNQEDSFMNDHKNSNKYQNETRGETTSDDSLIRISNSTDLKGHSNHEKRRRSKKSGLAALSESSDLDKKKAESSTAEKIEMHGNKKENLNTKWHLQPEVGMFYTFKKVTPSKDMVYITGFENENELSFKNIGYQFSLKLRREVLKNTTLTAGLTWQMINEYSYYNFYNIIADSVEVAQVRDDSFEVIAYSNLADNEVHNTLQYLGLNLGFIQRIKLLRREYNLIANVSLLKSAGQRYRGNARQHKFNANSTIVMIKGGFEKTISITPYWSVSVTPYVEQGLNTVYTKSAYRLSPLKVGLNIGLILPTGRK